MTRGVSGPLMIGRMENARLEVEIKATHTRTRKTSGPERLKHDVAEHGVHAGVCRITRLPHKAWDTLYTHEAIHRDDRFTAYPPGSRECAGSAL